MWDQFERERVDYQDAAKREAEETAERWREYGYRFTKDTFVDRRPFNAPLVYGRNQTLRRARDVEFADAPPGTDEVDLPDELANPQGLPKTAPDFYDILGLAHDTSYDKYGLNAIKAAILRQKLYQGDNIILRDNALQKGTIHPVARRFGERYQDWYYVLNCMSDTLTVSKHRRAYDEVLKQKYHVIVATKEVTK